MHLFLYVNYRWHPAAKGIWQTFKSSWMPDHQLPHRWKAAMAAACRHFSAGTQALLNNWLGTLFVTLCWLKLLSYMTVLCVNACSKVVWWEPCSCTQWRGKLVSRSRVTQLCFPHLRCPRIRNRRRCLLLLCVVQPVERFVVAIIELLYQLFKIFNSGAWSTRYCT